MPREPASRLGRVALRTRYFIEAGVFDVLSVVARHASPAGRARVASLLGRIQWTLDLRHRRVALSNLRLAYGAELATGATRRIARESMTHTARLALETLALDTYANGPIDDYVRLEGIDYLREAYDRGRGVIGVTGHIGHWELLSIVFGRLGIRSTGIARPLDNPFLESRLMRLRGLTGSGVIPKNRAFGPALKRLRHGELVGILADQRPKRGGIVVPFFGTEAYTTEGPAMLALASEAAIVPGFAVWERDGTLRLVMEPEVPVVRTGDREADARRITADCTAIIERWVRRYPEQWLWTHRRWAVPKHAAERRTGAGVTGAS
jgi:KDO2-lipid IV(A) lauroyltransferase